MCVIIAYPVIGCPIYSHQISLQKVLPSIVDFIQLCKDLQDPELYKVPNNKMKLGRAPYLSSHPFVCSPSPESITTNFFSGSHPEPIVLPPSSISVTERIEKGE